MNDDLITDLKQFIAATVSQQLAGVATKDDIADLRTELKGDIATLKSDLARVEGKIDEIAENIGDALSVSNDAFAEQVEKRLHEHVRQYHHA